MPTLKPVSSIPPQRRKRGKRAINPATVPTWARELAEQVAEDYGVPVPPIRWKVSRKERLYMDTETGVVMQHPRRYSSGATHFTTEDMKHTNISIMAGSDEQDVRLVLVHELAHWSLPARHHHSRVFWRRAWEMYKRYDVDLAYAFNREKRYRKKAIEQAPTHLRVAHELGEMPYES